MATANEILTRLGGPAKVARETEIPLTTIIGWRDANFIPEWRRPALFACAMKRDAALSSADFPTPDQRISRSKAAA